MLKLTAIGNLGRDATINQVNGKTVINFAIAHSEKYKDQQGNPQERTTWIDCAYWTERNVGPYLLKGTTVYVEGSPYTEMYTTKDGRPGVSFRLRVQDMQFVGNKKENNGDQNTNYTAPQASTAPATATVNASPNFDAGTEDLPF